MRGMSEVRRGLGLVVAVALLTGLLTSCEARGPAKETGSTGGAGPSSSATVTPTLDDTSVAWDPHTYPNFPKLSLTPGDLTTAAAAQVCIPNYTDTVRDVSTSKKKRIYGAYGIPYPQPRGTYECDHFIPLCLGGSNDPKNLWPQPAPQFKWIRRFPQPSSSTWGKRPRIRG